MRMTYSAGADAASVLIQEPITPRSDHRKERIDADRFVRYDAKGRVIEYEFLNVRRYGVRLEDLEHREELAELFREAGFEERDWGHPIPTKVRRRRQHATG
jgi:hypothetical protein